MCRRFRETLRLGLGVHSIVRVSIVARRALSPFRIWTSEAMLFSSLASSPNAFFV
jgi:hypothetical protein